MTPTLNLNDVIRDMARAHARFDYPRPLGVPGAPHVGDHARELALREMHEMRQKGMSLSGEEIAAYWPGIDFSEAGDVRDLSVGAQTAAEDLRNCLVIIGPLDDSMVREALQRLIGNALAKIEAGA